MRNEKGITLIALILIIVVLLILAGISISLVINNEANNIEITPKPQTPGFSNMSENEDLSADVSNEINDSNTLASDTNTVLPENTVTNDVQANTVAPENVVE